MDPLSLVLSSARVIGWALVHFIWQGALLGLIYKLIKTVLPRGEARYRFGMIWLIFLAVCPLLTVWRLLNLASPAIDVSPDVAATKFVVSEVVSGITWGSGLESLLPWMVLAWSCGVLFLSLRAWKHWRGINALVRAAETVPQWQETVNVMSKRFCLHRKVRVVCSKIIATPVLVGWLRPVIVLPMALVCNFPAAQIELIFAHELAHLRRWDPLANLFQVVVETLHFYHPVVHWISRDVRNEREICCDAMALSVTGGSRYEFVAALAELGELSSRHGSLLLAARGGILLDRVQQIVLQPPEPARAGISARFIAVLIGTLLVTTTLRLEWSQAQLQRNLTESLEQLSAALAPRWLPLVQPIEGARWSDLIPVHVTVMRPAVMEAPVAVVAAWLPIDHPEAMALPRLSPAALPIPDMPGAVRGLHLLIGDQTLVPDTSESATQTPMRVRQPVYPADALMHGIEGKVTVEFGIATDGSVQNLHVISAEPAGTFDKAALQAMRGWKYATSVDGLPERRYRQTLAFTLNAAHSDERRSGTSAGVVQAQAGCRVPTGTHICRWPDNGSGYSTP